MKKSYHNFLIVGTQRTGSSALAESIGTREQVVCGWEWTQRTPPWKKIEIATRGLSGAFTSLDEMHQQHMRQSMTDQCQWLGFRRLFRSSDKWIVHPRFAPALLTDRLEAHIGWLAKREDMCVIHIVRRDNIDWLKSKYVSKAIGSYVGKKYPKELQVVIPINKAIARLKSKEWVDQRLASLNETNQYLRIYYEDFLKQPQQATRETLDLFGVNTNSRLGEGMISRQSQGSASDYIANYAELKTTLNEKGLLSSSLTI